MSTLAEDARALMAATADVAGEKVSEARKRLAAALESGKELYGRVRDKAVEARTRRRQVYARNTTPPSLEKPAVATAAKPEVPIPAARQAVDPLQVAAQVDELIAAE